MFDLIKEAFVDFIKLIGKIAVNSCLFFEQRVVLSRYHFYIYDNYFIKEVQIKNIGSKDLIYMAIEYYSKNNFTNLERLIVDWESEDLFKDRAHILKSIRTCLIEDSKTFSTQDKCNIIIPILISTLDFVAKKQMNEIFNVTQPKGYPSLKNLLKELKIEITSDDMYAFTYINIINYIHSKKEANIYNEESIGADYNISDKVKEYNLERNSIIHGEELYYGTVENLIRIVHMINFVYLTEKHYKRYNGIPANTLLLMTDKESSLTS